MGWGTRGERQGQGTWIPGLRGEEGGECMRGRVRLCEGAGWESVGSGRQGAGATTGSLVAAEPEAAGVRVGSAGAGRRGGCRCARGPAAGTRGGREAGERHAWRRGQLAAVGHGWGAPGRGAGAVRAEEVATSDV